MSIPTARPGIRTGRRSSKGIFLIPTSAPEEIPTTPPCTDDKPFLDPPNAFADGFCYIGKVFSGSPMGFFGHADWMVAQYDGNISWMNFGDDSDFDLVLVPGNVSSGTGIGHGIFDPHGARPGLVFVPFITQSTTL